MPPLTSLELCWTEMSFSLLDLTVKESTDRRRQTRRKYNLNKTEMLFTFDCLKIILGEIKRHLGGSFVKN